MAKRVFIVHGWGGRPDCGWLAWINEQLSSKGFEVHAERMPDPDYPKIKPWVEYLSKAVGTPDKDTYFIGHSVGCQTIMRYVDSLPDTAPVGGAFFVAGFFNITSFETDEEKKLFAPWIKDDIDFKKVKKKIGKVTALFSDDDPYVPLSESNLFKEKLGANIIIEKGMGHYIESDKMDIQVLLEEFLKLTK